MLFWHRSLRYFLDLTLGAYDLLVIGRAERRRRKIQTMAGKQFFAGQEALIRAVSLL
jgi:hypothetical protein